MIATVKRAALALTMLLPALGGAPHAAAACEGGTTNAFFLGVIYDIEQTSGDPRNDFALDVDNFERFKGQLQNTYCFPDSNAQILAFKDDYSRHGVTYPAATEKAVKTKIAEFGAAASLAPDPMFFFMLSSHGIMYASTSCDGVRRSGGSLAALGGGGGQNGDLYDCELGAALNDAFPADTRMLVMNDCSFCGGFSDSLTAVSGTIPDGSLPTPSGIVAPNRVVITGCAVTTECFGSDGGAVLYKHMMRVLEGSQPCDGYTTPGFPEFQGINVPRRDLASNPRDGRCTASEWLFGAVASAYDRRDHIGIQEQFRMKYGFETLGEDILIF